MKITDPDTGQILEEYPDDDPFGEVLHEALRCHLLKFTGE